MKYLVIIMFPLGFKNPVYLEKDLAMYNENSFQQQLGSFPPPQTLDTSNNRLSNPGYSQPPTNRNFSGDVPVSVHHQNERVNSFLHSDHSFHVLFPDEDHQTSVQGFLGHLRSPPLTSQNSNLQLLECLTSDQNFMRLLSSASSTHFILTTAAALLKIVAVFLNYLYFCCILSVYTVLWFI